MDFIDYIARTNLFNFVIFAGIIIYLVVKLRVGSKIEDAKVSVDETIMASESAKVESEKKLEDIQDSMAHLEEDIDFFPPKISLFLLLTPVFSAVLHLIWM